MIIARFAVFLQALLCLDVWVGESNMNVTPHLIPELCL